MDLSLIYTPIGEVSAVSPMLIPDKTGTVQLGRCTYKEIGVLVRHSPGYSVRINGLQLCKFNPKVLSKKGSIFNEFETIKEAENAVRQYYAEPSNPVHVPDPPKFQKIRCVHGALGSPVATGRSF